MARRRHTDLWDDLLDVLRWLFSIIHPAWSLVLAAVFFFGAVAWFRFKVDPPELQGLAYLVGGVPAVVSLAAGFIAWLQRRERNRFFADRIDLERIRALSWQEFERRVADVYTNQGYAVELTGGGGADGGVDLRLRRDAQTTLVQWRVYKAGVRPVRELFGVMAAEGADRAVLDPENHPDLAARLTVPGYSGVVERLFIIRIAGSDWNCPQHIPPRPTA